MAKMLGYCGMDCGECPAYIATQTKNEGMKAKVAEGFTNTVGKAYGLTYSAADINCDGCVTNKRLVKHCGKCQIRVCGVGKKVQNCGDCKEYVCEKLGKMYTQLPPTAKANTEAHRAAKKKK